MKYNVTANSCDSLEISVSINATGMCEALAYRDILLMAFRDVRIIDGETGEVLDSHYMADSFFTVVSTYGSTLDYLKTLQEQFNKKKEAVYVAE